MKAAISKPTMEFSPLERWRTIWNLIPAMAIVHSYQSDYRDSMHFLGKFSCFLYRCVNPIAQISSAFLHLCCPDMTALVSVLLL